MLDAVRTGDLVADRFEVQQLAGSGGMGRVYRAIDRHTGIVVALKVLTKVHDPAGRFAREAQVLARLGHPHIVRYVAQGVSHEGEPWLAMEWLDGEDLAARIKRGRLGIAESVEWAIDVAEALGAAHAAGIVHRDLKPSNVFLINADLRQCRLLDFGTALDEKGPRVTATGTSMGTPGYMAPEQARSSARADARADVYSLGCVLFECLTGEPVFIGTHPIALLTKCLFEDPPRLRDKLRNIPPALDELLASFLSKNPDDRPADGRLAAAALRHLGTMPVALDAISTATSTHEFLTGVEQHAVAVIVLGPPAGEPQESDELALRKESIQRGARFEAMPDGSVAIVLPRAPIPRTLQRKPRERHSSSVNARLPDG
jgi:eukaryotic-like serine/threonine-protein kinase